jgi:hypothetical protein
MLAKPAILNSQLTRATSKIAWEIFYPSRGRATPAFPNGPSEQI